MQRVERGVFQDLFHSEEVNGKAIYSEVYLSSFFAFDFSVENKTIASIYEMFHQDFDGF